MITLSYSVQGDLEMHTGRENIKEKYHIRHSDRLSCNPHLFIVEEGMVHQYFQRGNGFFPSPIYLIIKCGSNLC